MIIYKTTNTVNGKWYIGKDANNRNYYLGSGKALKNAIKKYGKESFIKEILEECADLAHLSTREKHWISITSATTDPMSYNIASGGEGGDLSKFINYSKIDRSNYKMTGPINWYNSLTEIEKKAWHARQALKRCKGWYVSKVDDSTETFVFNIAKWCKENNIDSSFPSKLTNPKDIMFQGQHAGWRFRKEGQPELLPYMKTKRGKPFGTPNNHKGKSWKLIDGKRVWVNKEVNV
jgi:hypothetical protein